MTDARFFKHHGPFTLRDIAEASGAVLAEKAREDQVFHDVAPLENATEHHVSFFDNPKYLAQFKTSNAGACFVRERYIGDAPQTMAQLISTDPYRAYARTAQMFFPALPLTASIHASAVIDPTARVAATAHIAAGAVIGAYCEVGEHASIGANSVLERGVSIGDHSSVGPLCSISHAMIGSHVILHRGIHIGQDGFGFAMGATHEKVPQLGRVIIEDYVEIGSGTTIDRGTGSDTIVREGAKIDNLVQIGHNVQIGKSAIIIAQVGISGSTHIGNGAIIAGQAGLSGHLKIGAGARVAAKSGVMHDVPEGESYGGYPAIPVRDWHRQSISLAKLIRKRGEDA